MRSGHYWSLLVACALLRLSWPGAREQLEGGQSPHLHFGLGTWAQQLESAAPAIRPAAHVCARPWAGRSAAQEGACPSGKGDAAGIRGKPAAQGQPRLCSYAPASGMCMQHPRSLDTLRPKLKVYTPSLVVRVDPHLCKACPLLGCKSAH